LAEPLEEGAAGGFARQPTIDVGGKTGLEITSLAVIHDGILFYGEEDVSLGVSSTRRAASHR
jgi:hypothetical protein